MSGNRRGEPAPEKTSPSGRDALPEEQRRVLRKAIRLEWFSLVFLAVTVTLVALVSGQSQAMKAAWLEDSMSLLPPIAFLVAARMIGKSSDRHHPYGHHRSIGVAHVVSAAALLGMGIFLVVDSLTTLVTVERPSVGLTVVLGHGFWAGWSMIAVMVVTNIPPIFIGRAKMKLAEPLHDKVLYADADMNKANWTSALATVIGVLGIGVGLWWADSVAAILVSISILHDGVKNLRASILGLTDSEARTFDDKAPHPLIDEVERVAREAEWVADAASRVRDEGHVFHVEMFVVPAPGAAVTGARCEELRTALRGVDWKVHDVVIAPVARIPADQAFRGE
ncbi:cation transporter [Brachybacterium endophyticum]|uniref:Cation transporter n=1 Tax=Brachybacterium endophyticum TaxID=2182385 RepID=A0A2U2RKX6_9MICO|nr:cation transporter [Brachybacterium endophyticum]